MCQLFFQEKKVKKKLKKIKKKIKKKKKKKKKKPQADTWHKLNVVNDTLTKRTKLEQIFKK